MSNSPITRYSASFTAGGLLHKETSALLPLLLSEQREQQMREEIKQNQYLRINSESARERIGREIIKRVQRTDKPFWDFYMESSIEQQKMLLLYLCLTTYPLMFDFHFNVTLKQWNSSSKAVDPYFYQMEIERIATHDEVVDKWADRTRRNAISVYLRMLKEVRMLNEQNQLQPIHIEDRFWQFFVSGRELWFLDAALLHKQEKERIMRL